MFSKQYQLPNQVEELLKHDALTRRVEYGLNTFELSRSVGIALNMHLLPRAMRFEYAVIFRWHAGEKQPIHIDGKPPGPPRNASLNLLIKGGAGAIFEWYEASAKQTPLISSRGLAAFGIDERNARLRHSEPLQHCSVVKTNVPHRVTNISSETILLCLRMYGNPTLQEFIGDTNVGSNR